MYPQDDFYTKEFEDQMQMVDEFIYKTIQWKQDYSQYYMVGLLTSAHEVIERKAGDCQGQAVTTTSLLLSLGFEAWVVETPFHWWTMVRDEITGHVVFLNVHGSAGTLGNVLPQPIDLVYTRPKDSCTNCPSMFAHNQHPTLYISPPHRSIPLALTGAHIFVRSGWSWSDVSILALLEFTVAYGLGTTVYSSYYQADWNLSRMVKRGVIGTVLGAATMFGVTFWTTVFYPVTILHCIGIGTFALSFLTSDSLQTYL